MHDQIIACMKSGCSQLSLENPHLSLICPFKKGEMTQGGGRGGQVAGLLTGHFWCFGGGQGFLVGTICVVV